MTQVRLQGIWAASLIVLTLASYRWPVFGLVFACSVAVLVAFANGLLSIRSKKVGHLLGGSLALLICAACTGDGLPGWQTPLFTAIAALVGYAVVAGKVELTGSSEEPDDEGPAEKFKSGGGGSFGGGGASDKY